MRKAVVITGASKGIGLATARLLAARGFRCFGTVRTEEDAGRLRTEGIEPLHMDVTDPESVLRAAREAEAALPGGSALAALVNNAGIPAAGPVEAIDLDEARALFEVNLFGVLRTTQAFLPLLRASRGRIVNMSSVAGRFTFPFSGLYSASKFALEALSDALRRELGPEGIRVIVVEPGSVRTPIWDRVEAIDLQRYRGTPLESVMAKVKASAVRGGREGLQPEAVAGAVHRAITARRPPPRIPVVRSRLRWLLRQHLPVRLWDAAVARVLRKLYAEGDETARSPL